jgi:hypothetical protein
MNNSWPTSNFKPPYTRTTTIHGQPQTSNLHTQEPPQFMANLKLQTSIHKNHHNSWLTSNFKPPLIRTTTIHGQPQTSNLHTQEPPQFMANLKLQTSTHKNHSNMNNSCCPSGYNRCKCTEIVKEIHLFG